MSARMLKIPRLIVFGGASIEGDEVSGYYTKSAVCNYLRDMAQHADEILFFAQLVSNSKGNTRFLGALDFGNIRVFPLAKGKIKRFCDFIKIIPWLKGACVLLFLPNSIGLRPIASLVKRRANVMGIYLGDDYESHASEHQFFIGPIGRTIFLESIRGIIRKADFVIARGQHLENIVRTFDKPIYQTVPIGHVNLTEDFKLIDRCCNKQEIKLLYVGKIEWRKGIRELLEAFKIIQNNYVSTNFQLRLIGEGPNRVDAHALALDFDIQDNLDFTGYIDNKLLLRDYWNEADLLIVPTSLHKEGVCRVIDEALSYGLPVVATKIGGVGPEFVNNNEVHLVSPGDSHALAVGIGNMIFDDRLRQKCVRSGMARVKKWQLEGPPGHQHASIFLKYLNMFRK